MGIQIYCEAPRIYREDWSGKISIEEVEETSRKLEELLKQNNETKPVVLIINGGDALKSIPFEIRQLKNILQDQDYILAYLTVQVPLTGQIAARVLTTLTQHTIEAFNDLESAQQRAHALVLENP